MADHTEREHRAMERAQAKGLRVIAHPDPSDDDKAVYDLNVLEGTALPQLSLEQVEEILAVLERED